MTCFSAVQLRGWKVDNVSSDKADVTRYVQPLVRSAALFGGVSDTDLTWLLNVCDLKTARPGDILYQRGDLPVALYLLLSGSVCLSIESGEASLVKERLVTGAVFGDVALMAIQPYSDTATCVEAAEILVLSSEALAHLNSDMPELYTLLLLNLARDHARRLMEHDRFYLEFQQSDH